jgi:uncharacterized membrane protein (DUF2068 family)
VVDTPPTMKEPSIVTRGTSANDPPRSRLVLRVIATERALRGLLLIVAGIYLFSHLRSDLGRLAERVMRQIELDPRRPVLHRLIERLHQLHAHELRIAAILAVGYGTLELVEGGGLWLDRLWAEYLTLVATSLLIPFELYVLVRNPSPWKAGGILVNVLIVAYLFWLLRRRLARRPGTAAAGDAT